MTKGILFFSFDLEKEFREELHISNEVYVFFNQRSITNRNKIHLFVNHWRDFVYWRTTQNVKRFANDGTSNVIESKQEVIYITTLA